MNREPLWIVKIGGSLMDTSALVPWLAAIAGTEGPARLVVAGGGPFADQVRAAQQRLGFDDLAAHRMAILAMQQYALVLQALEPRLGLVESEEEVAALRRVGGRAVWLPWCMIGTDGTIEPSWEITSDSLALILARRLAAERLVLVKSAAMQAGADLASLAAAGVVDAAFTRLAAGFEQRIAFAHRDAPPLGTLFPASSRVHG
ncbi:amino acid kinase family protein [Marinimicrococcus flavescens]|uniref:Aspartate/glutamate/uridylate kinase domain-containing protein n=1 Tax=Marinimicrococcus flavescens TaxID=3031815 RepID=A0AAP3XQU2_9PROT|nr:hypothetical protein [Marinimicrococcus flavescens]